MLKFNIKENSVKRFKATLDNIKEFKVVTNNVKSFITKAYEALIIVRGQIENKYKSSVKIGGARLLLSELPTKLKDLPSSLRQFVGSYVYVLAKMRFNNTSKYIVSKLNGRAVLRFLIRSSYSYMNSALIKVKSKIKLASAYTSRVKNQIKIKVKNRFNNIFNYNTYCVVRQVLKTKISIIYKSKSVIKGRLLAKLKLANEYFSSPTQKMKIISRIKFKNNISLYDVVSRVKALGRVRFQNRSVSDTLLTIKAKLKFGLGNKYKQDVANSRAKLNSKAKANSLYTSDAGLSNDKVLQCIRLIEYEHTMLKDTPTSLYEFCYKAPENSWDAIKRRNNSWEAVKNRYQSWKDMLG